MSFVIDSGESERLWCLFQDADPKGSKRSRLDFATKEKEVGIAANIHLERYLKKAATPTRKKRTLAKTPSKIEDPLPIKDFVDVDLGGLSDEGYAGRHVEEDEHLEEDKEGLFEKGDGNSDPESADEVADEPSDSDAEGLLSDSE